MGKNFSKLTDNQLIQYQNNDKKVKTIADYTTLYNQPIPLKENLLFAESYSGNYLSYSIVQFIKQVIKEFKNMKVVLSTTNMQSFYSAFSEKEQKSIYVVKRDSYKYIFALVQSKFIINDGDFPDYFISKKNQIVINTAEAFLGFYTDELSMFEKRSQRAILQSDYLLMTDFEQQKLFDRIKLHNIKNFYLSIMKCNLASQNPKWNVIFLKKNSNLDSDQQLKKFIKVNKIEGKVVLLVHPSELKFYKSLADFGKYVRPFDYSIVDFLNNIKSVYSDSDILLSKNIFNSFDKFIILENQTLENYSPVLQNSSHTVKDLLTSNKIWNEVSNGKKNIIIYAGGFQNNGVTTSAINLSYNIDYKKYNLIYIDKSKYDESSKKNVSRLNKLSTLIFRTGATDYLMEERIPASKLQAVEGYDSLSKKEKSYAINVFQRELVRLLGNTAIDVAIDFSGYVVFWTSIMAFSTAKTKLIYQHNDMYAELTKIVDGKLKHANKLPQVFKLYKFFDSIVSVGKKTLELNAEHLSKYGNISQYKYVANSIVVDDILSKSRDNSNVISLNNHDYLEEEGIFKMLPDIDEFNLVNIGRMGPEKDQQKLVKAFDKAKKELKIPMKLFILGSGELEKKLKEQVSMLGLESDVVFVGQVANPYIFLKRASLFVLSSNHEGQPMVLLEALTLEKPIIATDIAGNRSVLGDDYSDCLVDNSVIGISDRIVSLYKENKINSSNVFFDSNKYNKDAMSLFYSIIDEDNYKGHKYES
ncbi:glycosyltransferase [Weissella bombi]|uniref:Glycosyltransferase involved in cell wall bisynthesis n=1 Tax=Weissella bombi TaxID=1505725 RepID=A0A1C3Z9W4_9LACO|nr:glycosyltransferase [Weissella bombi]SCB79169.1 Glycosyltransferase involved in cell wall bisynthesis [Weissella bombi]